MNEVPVASNISTKIREKKPPNFFIFIELV